mmetsp:Transcript_847/g.1465  ORF Transcript_847/g.1465 Transcript_847/m.1465 type:complete len:1381 (+) Transcript_847:119-4261(+)
MNRNTITRQITTSEEKIRQLMDKLEDPHSSNAELASCQSEVDKLFGKLSDNNSVLTADVKEMLSNLRAGKLQPDELEKLLVGEREKVSYSLKLADEAKKNLEDVMSFVQHFVHDVERGRPIPKESFQSLFHELDTIADSMNSMAKVHRSNDIDKLKRIMQTHLEEKKEMQKIEGVVSLKNILNENSREARERQRKQSESYNPRKSVANIGSLARPKSSQNNNMEGSINPRLGSPIKTDLMSMSGPLRNGSPPPLKRSGTAGSMSGSLGNMSIGGGPPSSPGNGGGGFDRWSADEGADMDASLQLQGRTTILKPEKKTKKQGKKEKRMSSAQIYAHTEDDASSVGSGGLGNSQPISLAEFVPPDAKKLQVNQGVQTDDVAIDFNHSSIDLSASETMTDVEQESTKNRSGPRSAAGKRVKSPQRRKDGKAISMVSARRGSRENNKAKSNPSSTRGGDHSPLPEASARQYLKNFADSDLNDDISPDGEGGCVDSEIKDKVREMQEREDAKVDDMNPLDAKSYLNKKEMRLLLLEAKLKKQETDITAKINVRVAEEVAKTKKRQPSVSATSATITKKAEEKPTSSRDQKETGKTAETTVDPPSNKTSTASVPTSSKQPDGSTAMPSVEGAQKVTKANEDRQTQGNNKKDAPASSSAGQGQGIVSTKTQESGKRASRASFSKKAGKTKLPEPLNIDKIVEKIIKFLPKPEAEGNKHSKIPVHNISMEDSSEENLKLPPIVTSDVPGRKANAVAERKKANKTQDEDVQVADPASLAVAGVRVTNSMEFLVDDDAVSVLSGQSNDLSQDNSNVQRLCKTPIPPVELVNDIWIPPPGHINKKMFNTICIFPLHTVDQGTSTDDLLVSADMLPLTMSTVPLDDDQNAAGKGTVDHFPPSKTLSMGSSSATGPQIVPVCLSNVEAVSRPATGGEGRDNIVISKPLTGADKSRRSAKGSAELTREDTFPSKVIQPVSLEEVTEELKKSGLKGNPLLQLYLCFYKDLDVQCRHHLLAAASGVAMDASRYTSTKDGYKGTPYAVASLQGMSDMFEVVAEEVSKLEYTSYYAMQALLQTDRTINDLVLIANSGEELTDSFYFHLKQASIKLGEVKIAESWVNMLLHDSRAIFTRTRALGIDPVLIGPQFSIAYQAFLSCQGSNLQLKKKLDEVHALMQKYLAKPVFHAQNMPVADTSGIERYCEQLKERCEDLEEAMDDIKEENEELREELTAMDSQLDRTPGALLFYAVLHSPKLPEIVANHIQVLQAVKTTVEGNEHFDFITLKRRLEKCLQGLPAMQQFLKKFNTLHKKWADARSKMFLDRRQIGADADNHYVCPICNIDSRMAEVDLGCPLVTTAPKNTNSAGALTTKMKGSRKGGKNTASQGATRFGQF